DAGPIPQWDAPPSHFGRWTRYPLIALAIVITGPSILTPIVYLALRLSGISELEGYGIEFNEDTVAFMVVFPLLSALANLSFIVLYKISSWRAAKEWPNLRSVKTAMWSSMSIPNMLFFIGTPEEMILKVPDAGQEQVWP